MSITKAAMRGVQVVLHEPLSTIGNGLVIAIPDSFKHHTIIIKGSAGVSAGAIQPETADTFDYAGTWAPIGGGPVSVVVSAEVVINLEGVYRFLRARISTTIADGTVTVSYVGS